MPKLAVRRGDTLDQEVDLGDRSLRIGRGEQNDVILRDQTKAVSRFHAELLHENGRYVLVDQNSQNGLWVRGRRETRLTLEPGVPVTIGPYTLTLTAPPILTADTLVGGGAARARPGQTLVQDLKAPVAAGPAPPAPGRTPPPPKPVPVKPTPPRPVVPARAPLPKSVVFAGVAVLIVVALVVGRLLWSSSGPVEQAGGMPPGGDTPAIGEPPSTELVVQQRLAEARALMDRGEIDKAVAELEQVFAVDPGNLDAIDLRTTIETTRAAAGGGGAPPPLPPPPPEPVVDSTRPSPPPAPPTPTTAPPTSPPSTSPPSPGPTVRRRAGESQADWTARDRETADRYGRARVAVDSGAFANAITLLNEIQQSEPDYRDVPSLLTRARDGQRAAAQKALEEATRLETAGDWPASAQQYDRVKELDPSMTGVADESSKRVRARMKTEGTDAFTRARQYDAVGRIADAITFYDRAFRYLPDDDPNKKTAKERADLLRAKK